MRRLLDAAVPVARFQVERAIETGDLQSTEGRDEILTLAAGVIAPLGPSVLREELVKLVSGRLNVSVSLVESVGRRPGAPPRRRAGGRRGRAVRREPTPRASPRRASAHEPGPHGLRRRPSTRTPARRRAATGATAPSGRWTAASRPSAPSSPTASRSPRRASAASPRPTSRSSSPRPMTRRAAEYLRGRVRTPAADLPPDDEPLARLVAELVIRAGQLEATPAKLELEALQLDLSRLDRLIAAARVTGGEGMRDLAVRRQVVLDDIRHRLN